MPNVVDYTALVRFLQAPRPPRPDVRAIVPSELTGATFMQTAELLVTRLRPWQRAFSVLVLSELTAAARAHLEYVDTLPHARAAFYLAETALDTLRSWLAGAQIKENDLTRMAEVLTNSWREAQPLGQAAAMLVVACISAGRTNSAGRPFIASRAHAERCVLDLLMALFRLGHNGDGTCRADNLNALALAWEGEVCRRLPFADALDCHVLLGVDTRDTPPGDDPQHARRVTRFAALDVDEQARRVARASRKLQDQIVLSSGRNLARERLSVSNR